MDHSKMKVETIDIKNEFISNENTRLTIGKWPIFWTGYEYWFGKFGGYW